VIVNDELERMWWIDNTSITVVFWVKMSYIPVGGYKVSEKHTTTTFKVLPKCW
jgi:hypothetical protein